MWRVLALLGDDNAGRALEASLRQALSEVAIVVVHDWAGVVLEFFPTVPSAVVVDLVRLNEASIRRDLAGLLREAHWARVVLVGDPSLRPPAELLLWGRRGVAEIIPVDSSSVPRLPPDLRERLAPTLVTRAVGLIVRRRDGRPLPARVLRAMEFALQRTERRLTVAEMASALSVARRTLREGLHREGVPSPRRLISLGRCLWAVRDLEAHPAARSGDVAAELGFPDAATLGNTLHRHLGVRIREARQLGLEGALGRFAEEFRGPEAARDRCHD
jgi:AraC-like DNA-binding protein